jgi:thymidylate synthase ThyX
MFKPTAKVICDSINTSGDRLTTFVLTYHRMIHSEFMTHRILSKNSSSSRAIPVEKMIALVEGQEVYPLHWGKNQKGMSARQELSSDYQIAAKKTWDSAREKAIAYAKELAEIGVHKQVVNRLLEPFSTITVICSGTEYQNFFNQRCHPDAQPEIKALAEEMHKAYYDSTPKLLLKDEWHIPFVDDMDTNIINCTQDLIRIAIGRCARVSYLNHAGDRSIKADIELFFRLLNANPPHLSPFEHVAIALPNSEKRANFKGFESYRYQLFQ